MPYYCFLCNESHEDSPTEEHFIPRSIGGPENQCLPVCQSGNVRSNSLIDNDVRDILYLVRYQSLGFLKRTGDALLGDGTLKKYKFSYDESEALNGGDAFKYFFDRESNTRIPDIDVYAIKFSIGLVPEEQRAFCRGLAKMSIGSLAYLLLKEGMQSETIRQIFSQTSVDSLRHSALDLSWSGNPTRHRFSLGRTDVLSRLQSSCENPRVSNHVIQIDFQKDESIHVEGMLYNKYGWELVLENDISICMGTLRLENAIPDMPVSENMRDTTLSPDSICILNPNFRGKEPALPQSWRNSSMSSHGSPD